MSKRILEPNTTLYPLIGLTHDCGTVRERPIYNFHVEDLRRAVRRD